MREWLLVMACIAITVFLGWNALSLLSWRKTDTVFSLPEVAGLSYLLGIGFISIQMFVIGLLGAEFTRFNLLIFWFFVLAVTIAKRIKTGFFLRLDTVKKPGVPKPMAAALIFLIGLQAFYNFFRALLKPIESYDSVAIYGLKSKIIYLAGGINVDFFKNIASNFQGAHPDYPLLIPLSEAWVYTFLGNFNEFLVKMIFPLFYLSFIFIFYSVLMRVTKKQNLSVLATFFLATVKQFADYSTIGYCDLALGIYFAVSVFYLYLWIRAREYTQFFYISMISSILCFWTKNEGALLAFIVLFILLFFAVRNMRDFKRKESVYIFVYIFSVICALAAWIAFKKYHGLVNENFNLSMVKPASLAQSLKKIPAVIYGYQKEFFGFKKWNIIWILFISIFVMRFQRIFMKDLKYITLIFFLFALGYSAMYIFSTEEIGYLVSFTESRFLLHIFPVAVFWMAIVLDGQLKENSSIFYEKR